MLFTLYLFPAPIEWFRRLKQIIEGYDLTALIIINKSVGARFACLNIISVNSKSVTQRSQCIPLDTRRDRLMKRMNGATIFMCLLMLSISSSAHADTLFQQLPDYWAGYWSDIPSQQMADNFSLSSSRAITAVQWWGGYYSGLFADNFTVRFYDDTSGGPGNLLASYNVGTAGQTDTGVQFSYFGREVYSYSIVLPNSFNATGGITYWVSILNGNEDNWIWATANETGWDANRNEDTGGWNSSSMSDFAFILQGNPSSVPEPTSLFLLGTGLGVIGLAAWRRKK
jgi:hypothetical protein